jgi:hypothetical protein
MVGRWLHFLHPPRGSPSLINRSDGVSDSGPPLGDVCGSDATDHLRETLRGNRMPISGFETGASAVYSVISDHDSYLVDSASSHMLVSKIKPCMSKYKQSYCETANGSLNQLSFI